MSRRTLVYTVPQDGPERDRGKAYLITEMSAAQAEWWATRALLALTNSGLEIPDEIADGGIAALAAFGFKIFGRVSPYDLKPLMDEMLECVKFMPDPEKYPDLTRALTDGDIEEVKTRLLLRERVWELHTGFSIAAALSKSKAAAKG